MKANTKLIVRSEKMLTAIKGLLEANNNFDDLSSHIHNLETAIEGL